MKRILYIHGIGSTGGGNTVDRIRKTFTNVIVDSPEIPTMPKEAFKLIEKMVTENHYDIIIGTSLGGFYAMMISGIPKILINPAIKAVEDIPTAIGYGEHEYLRERKSGEKTYTINDNYVAELKYLEDRFFNEWIDNEYIYETTAIFGTNDTLISHIEDYKNIYKAHNMITAEFGHRMDNKTFNNVLIPTIKKILNAEKEEINIIN